jgi:uncharacterized protein YndB with AHSA1/START domain
VADAKTIVLERSYAASIDDVWALWTTKDGIESWWGPEGFSVTVQKIDLRVGGELRYAMTATAAAQIEFMKQAGMPLTTEARVVYSEVVRHRRLAYVLHADFVPGVKPYDVATLIEFYDTPPAVRMVLRFDVMHDASWTERARVGHESQLGKLQKLLEARGRRV